MNIQVNDCVTILGHVGIIDDIAKSEKGKTLILWRSLKGIWNHHPQEWLDITAYPNFQIKPTTRKDLEKDYEYYCVHCIEKTEDEMEAIIREVNNTLLSAADKQKGCL